MTDETGNSEMERPADFLGNFAGYIARIQEDLETQFGDDAGQFDSVTERAEAQAPFIAAQNWLVEKWGESYPCPVCRNVEWTVSDISPTILPAGFLGFYVVCGYCANAMQVVPGYAELEAPRLPDQQLELPDQ